MAFKKGKATTGAAPLPGVTAENYLDNFSRFEDAKGTAMDYTKAAGGCFIITPDMQNHRNAWGKYFTLKGDKRQLKSMKLWLKGELGRQHGQQFAVPAEWPWQFDQSVSEEMCS